MNQFFKFVFASCIGVALAIVAVGALFFFLMIGIGSSQDKTVKVDKNSVIHLKFDQPIPEQTNNVQMNPFDFSSKEILGLNDMVKAIEHATEDPKVQGILLDMGSGLQAGVAKAASLREALKEFKDSGKFIIAYSKYYSQGSYYMASVADKVYMNPLGGVDFHGLSATVPFFKNMLDKIGVKMQVFYAGDFKSATEPYRLTEMSDSNRLQLRQYIEPVYNNFLADIGSSRNKSVSELRALANGLKVGKANDAVSYGLVDEIGYIDDVIGDIKGRVGINEDDKLKTVSLTDYASSYSEKKDYKTKEKIAIIYAEGPINQDQGDRGTIVDNDYIKVIRKIRKNDKIKAIVLRVNSPGGSAIASENIWRELSLAKEAGKPVVVSMGDYAASGGYYISCMADKILAEENTLTGSIGVFSMIPLMDELFNDKLGINFDTVKTTNYSVGLNTIYPMDEFEKNYVQNITNHIYDMFLQRVAEGRNMTVEEVHKIAKGRVWVGSKAKEIGLVDEIGDLDAAIAVAAELASLDKYRIAEYPTLPDPLQEIINELTGQKEDDAIRNSILEKEMGDYYPLYQHLKELTNAKGVQARLPILINFN